MWNGAVDHRPALVVRGGTAAEVRAAVLAARSHELPLSVLGGGHDWAGRALRRDGLVIDLSAMRHVAVDAGDRVATVGGGATLATSSRLGRRMGCPRLPAPPAPSVCPA
jgi:FAD/FMN-containing dehydrogenase